MRRYLIFRSSFLLFRDATQKETRTYLYSGYYWFITVIVVAALWSVLLCLRSAVYLASPLNERGQVDLIDYRTQPDGEYKWMMHYKEHLTKLSVLRPLTQKLAVLVAAELFDIFMTFGGHIFFSPIMAGNLLRTWSRSWPPFGRNLF